MILDQFKLYGRVALVTGATMMDEEVVLIDIFSPLREDFLTKE